MRMKELAAASGVPRTTIHFYLREGLLPPPSSKRRNAALYDEAHLERLRLIGELRSERRGPLSIARLRRVLEQVDRGVPLELATSLQRAVTADPGAPDLSLEQLARRAGLSAAQARGLVDVGVLLPTPGEKAPRFGAVELELATRFARLLGAGRVRVEDAAAIARGIRAVSLAEMRLRDRAVAGASAEATARISLELEELGQILHGYLFRRCREHEIEVRARRERRAR